MGKLGNWQENQKFHPIKKEKNIKMNYGTMSSIPENMSESLNGGETKIIRKIHKIRERLAYKFESRRAHWITLGLVAADFAFVLSIIIVSFLWPEFEREEHILFLTLEIIAFTINAIFVVEVVLKLFVFGIQYYTKIHHWHLHLFDAVVVITTFFLEIFLRGKQREVVGLLVLLRLWRLIKVLSTVAVGLIEYDQDKVDHLKVQRKELREELARLLSVIDKISREDDWNEQKMARIFNNHQNYLLNENYENNENININVDI